MESSELTVAGLLAARAEDTKLGLLAGDESWTWAEVVAESAARGALLEALRVPGPFHVGVLLDNVPEFLFWLGGAALAGATVVGINPTRRGPELESDVRHTDCQLVVTDATGAALLKDLDTGVAADRVLDIGTPAYKEMVANHAGAATADRGVDPSTLLLLLFTSGTTGAPKAVRCTQGRLASIAEKVETQYGVNRDDVCYSPMPLFHGNALMALWAPAVRLGATVALTPKFSAGGFLADVRRYGATYFTYVGKALTYVLATPEQPDDADNPLRLAFGNEASDLDIERFERRFGCRVVEGYGSSEGGATVVRVPGMPPGSLGVGAPGVTVMNPEIDGGVPAGDLRPAAAGCSTPRRRPARSSTRSASSASRATTATTRRPRSGRATAGTGAATSRTATTRGSSGSPVAPPTGCGSTARTSRPRPSSGSSSVSTAS